MSPRSASLLIVGIWWSAKEATIPLTITTQVKRDPGTGGRSEGQEGGTRRSGRPSPDGTLCRLMLHGCMAATALPHHVPTSPLPHQMSAARLWQLKALCMQYPGPVSAVLYVGVLKGKVLHEHGEGRGMAAREGGNSEPEKRGRAGGRELAGEPEEWRRACVPVCLFIITAEALFRSPSSFPPPPLSTGLVSIMVRQAEALFRSMELAGQCKLDLMLVREVYEDREAKIWYPVGGGKRRGGRVQGGKSQS